ncbi:MAG: hypothetical protein KF901_21890 [Myxococcales bacterium]|nr:hypothetical protein [Myxococcales bacterium]
MTKSLSLAFALALGATACGSPKAVPEYPFPASPPLEETDLAAYLDLEPAEVAAEEEEEWDDGLSDEDLQPSGAATTEEAAAE